MTTTQVAYNEHLENVRHHVATERETNRSNLTNEAEQRRHNLVGEQISRDTLSETILHNRNTEANSRYAAELSYAATKYSADMHVAATKYAASMNYAATIYSANRAKEASLYNANMQYSKQLAANSSAKELKTMELDYRRGNDNAQREQSFINTKYSADKAYGGTAIGTVGRLVSTIGSAVIGAKFGRKK